MSSSNEDGLKHNEELDSLPFELTDTDRENLAGGDVNFLPHDWEDLKCIIGRVMPDSWLTQILTVLLLSSCQ